VGQGAGNQEGAVAVNLSARLSAVQRERGRRCSACGGTMEAAAPRPKTWRESVQEYSALPDEEKVAMAAHMNKMHLLAPRLQAQAYRLYCQQQGIPYEYRGRPYSDPNPPPAPTFPESGPAPKLPHCWQ
jgi:hypothetical protein